MTRRNLFNIIGGTILLVMLVAVLSTVLMKVIVFGIFASIAIFVGFAAVIGWVAAMLYNKLTDRRPPE